MKQIFTLLLIGLIVISCKKDDDNGLPPIEQLPLETQIGAGTFGCLIDGEPFIDNDGNYNCYYQLVNGGYSFGIQGRDDHRLISSISILTTSLELEEGQNYTLSSTGSGNAYAVVGLRLDGSGSESLVTSIDLPSNFRVTKFDEENRIVSATFNIQVRNTITNEVIKITSGRFDTFYGQ